MNKVISSGKRKTAVARAVLTDGTGKVLVNGKDYKSLQEFDKLMMEEPLRIAEQVLGKLTFNAEIVVHGSGERSQIDAARLALAKGIVKFTGSKDLATEYTTYDRTLLVADVRRKETYKPGDSKARSKRQTSYR